MLPAIVHMLMGARSYLGRRFASSAPVDEAVVSAYAKLLGGGLFRE